MSIEERYIMGKYRKGFQQKQLVFRNNLSLVSKGKKLPQYNVSPLYFPQFRIRTKVFVFTKNEIFRKYVWELRGKYKL